MPRQTIASLQKDLENMQRERDASIAAATAKAVEEYKADLTRRAHQYADENDLCEQFDTAMKALDLLPREIPYVVAVDITVSGQSELEAAQKVAQLMSSIPADAVQEHSREDVYGYEDPRTVGWGHVRASGGWWELSDINED